MGRFKKFDQMKLEKLLEMSSGYVLDFSDRTFENFILDSVGYNRREVFKIWYF